MTAVTAWQAIQPQLREKIGGSFYDVWIRPLGPVQIAEGRFEIYAPSELFRDWVRENYRHFIENLLAAQQGRSLPVRILSKEEPGGAVATAPESLGEPIPEVAPELAQSRVEVGNTLAGPPSPSSLSPNKTFENFVVGACNEFAYAAALAVTEDLGGPQYNPLFIHGSTGLGKTHLMHAIGNRVLQRDPSARVVYISAEQFTNDVISAIRYKQMHEFRERYRQGTTLLLVDDIQFFSNKDRTQEEFFHTFEWLKERRRQLVFTADMLPREIKGFEPRLRTRCESGMVTDMQVPDQETLMAILEQKSADRGLRMPKDLAGFVVARIQGSIREVEGVLNNLTQLCRMTGQSPSLDLARSHLSRLLPNGPASPTPESILAAVAQSWGVTEEDLKGTRRPKHLVTPRHVAMWMIRRHCELSFPELGRLFSKDHSTIQHAVDKIESMLESDVGLRGQIQGIERGLFR